ncbi:carbohydrate kinase family protein [Spiribacter halobius]|uniref:Carbohydrate kinase family protein n=1 Tax=Sediminicurvatus halobius TaxID=2182432 RepID=A0A2U2MVX2_9GAMM|nr:carbohydrate kinase family protein [Spiribacter halobius]PWG61008.1 carbohydrate kinase family protein [Spiribacter halobius]UEX78727.1 carbohydrate kinase family protein [Spiribacter halobius]
MSILISGSVAYDTIMVFQDRFGNHILPDQVHILNVSFLVPEMRREFGGCAGNVAYSLKLLGEEPVTVAAVGADFRPYAEWMDRWGISRDYVKELPEHYTAQAYITTDLDDNQITAFHPGAMGAAHDVPLPPCGPEDIGIVAPNGPEGMVRHAAQLAEAGTPFIFDPGQAMPLFDGEQLLRFVDQARWVSVNDYECRLLCERTGLSSEQVSERVAALIVTRGAEGSWIYAGGERLEIPAATPEAVLDPTGCGDAYRAGLLYGLQHGLDWHHTGRIAALMGALKVARHGTQNHHFTMDEFRRRYEREFGELW